MSPTVVPLVPSLEQQIPVAIVTQSSLDVLLTGPTGTATTTIEITTPSLEELGIDPTDKDMSEMEGGDITSHFHDLTTMSVTTDMPTRDTTPIINRHLQLSMTLIKHGLLNINYRLDTLKPGLDPEHDHEHDITEKPDGHHEMTMSGITDDASCKDNVCRNGGTCLSTLTGPKCHCPLQFSGRQCEEEVCPNVLIIILSPN